MARAFSLLLLLILACGSGLVRAADTLLVLSDGAPAYELTAQRIRERLSQRNPPLVVETTSFSRATATQISAATLVITIGTQAAENVVNSFQPDRLICALLTHQTFSRLPPLRAGAQRSAVFIDQPASRQLALVRMALPATKRLAIVYSDASRPLIEAIDAAARGTGLSIDAAVVNDEQPLYNALRSVLSDESALLTVPDTSVYNNFTIQNVLLTAYRERTPVIGFSPAYVRAGAVVAVYSTPEQVGDQVADAAMRALAGNPLPPPAFPAAFSVSTNPHVARSLSLTLPDPAQIEAQLRRLERPR
jgi:ABC-type uncharacterized transport system substrate-binding protein